MNIAKEIMCEKCKVRSYVSYYSGGAENIANVVKYCSFCGANKIRLII